MNERRPETDVRRPGAYLFTGSLALLALWIGPQLSNDLWAAAPSPSLSGRAAVIDGDTLRLQQARIRLWGVDAPEAHTPEGRRATGFMARALSQGPVRCTDTGGRSHKRIVARCRTADGRDLAEALVRAGWAVDWPKFSKGRYAAAEREARRARRGLHADARSALSR